MGEGIVVYGIPTCATVRRARAWLTARGADHRFVDLRAAGVDAEQAARWVRALGSGPLRNTSGASYRALPAAKAGWDDAQWIQAFAADPMLVRRPVIEVDGRPILAGFRDPGPLEAAL